MENHLKSEFTSPENESTKNQHQWWENGKKSLQKNKIGWDQFHWLRVVIIQKGERGGCPKTKIEIKSIVGKFGSIFMNDIY